jgi:hypothetical protein
MRNMHIRSSVLVYLLVSGAALAGCTSGADDQPPVAKPSLTVNKEKAAIGSPLTLTYRFEPTRAIDGNYWVFVHVLDPEGERMWGDDHLPAVPTSSWKPGEPVEYSRTIFLPNFPYVGPAQIRIGLYMPKTDRRLRLDGTEVAQREYLVGRLQIQPQSENIFLIYKDGWHQSEVDPRDPAVEWQWSRKTASITFRNPKKDSTVYLEYAANSELFNPPQQVTLRIGDQVIGQFAADAKGVKLVTFPINAAQLGTGDVTELVIDVDRTFQPGGGDKRELGIRVFHAFVEPK